MGNTHFSFKQFTIQQDKCAMKVCTDACLFGAWSAREMNKYLPAVNKILDAGAGTGLLSLMLAQKSNALIQSIEIDSAAAIQAGENFAVSPWNERLQIIPGSLVGYVGESPFDFIICNPPFYEGDLKSSSKQRNAAMHDSELTLREALIVIRGNLAKDGFTSIMVPYNRTADVENLALQIGLYSLKKAFIRQTAVHPFFRTFILLSDQEQSIVDVEHIIIKDHDETYTKAFTDLLKDYYLAL